MPEIFLSGIDLSQTPALGFRRPQAATEAASRSYVDAPPILIVTGALSFTAAAAGVTYEYDAAANANFTLPNHSNVAMEVGTRIRLRAVNTGKATIIGASGVVIQAPGGVTGTRVQFSTIMAEKRFDNVWVLSGDLG